MDSGIIYDGLFAVLAVDDRDRHTPGTLTGNAPVAAVTNHALDALFAPCRNPLDIFDCFDCLILKTVYRAEPLFSCTVNDWLMATPAVRILVDDLLGCQHCADFGQLCSDCTVCLIGVHALEFACLFGLTTLIVNTYQDADVIVILADLKVLDTIARCSVYASGTAFQCNMIAYDYRRKAVIQRMLGLDVFQFCTGETADHFIFCDAGCFHGCADQFCCHAVVLVADLYQRIIVGRTNADRQVTRDCPGSGCPDHEVDLFLFDAQLCEQTLVVSYLELYIDRIARIILILDLCLCQSGVAVRAPVNRFQALIHIATLCHFAKDFYLACLVFRL